MTTMAPPNAPPPPVLDMVHPSAEQLIGNCTNDSSDHTASSPLAEAAVHSRDNHQNKSPSSTPDVSATPADAASASHTTPNVTPTPPPTPDSAPTVVRFCGLVRVCLIPHRNAYSSHVRSKLWASRNEIRKNAARNTLEYAYEGWEIKGVVEDEAMVLCEGGRRIHPIHFVSPDERKNCINSFLKKRRRGGNTEGKSVISERT